MWYSAGNLTTSVPRVSSLPTERGSARRVRAATFTPPARRHIDDARSGFTSFETSWAASRCLESPRLVYTMSHGSKRTMWPLSTSANLFHLMVRPSGE